MTQLFITLDSGAKFSPCRTWRYELWRTWGDEPPLVFIGLNPSTADETQNDNTIRRCIDFAERERCGGMVMLNLFAFCSTKPKGLLSTPDPVGPDNDATLIKYFTNPDIRCVAAWGSHKTVAKRVDAVLALTGAACLQCFGFNDDGQPKHPLFLRRTTPLIPLRGDV